MIMWHGPNGRGGRRARHEAAARVGLTDRTNGTALPRPPTDDAPSFTPAALWANARTTWRGFVRVLGLVWNANGQFTVALAVLNLLQGGLPAARVWISKLLID